MDQPFDVLVVGSLHLDIMVRAGALPQLDETARGSSWRMQCGGKGGNQACWASRSGARTAMLSRVGDDDFGKRLVSHLQSLDVDATGVSVDHAAGSGMSVAIVRDDGEYGAVIVSGSNLRMEAEAVARQIEGGAAPRILLLQNEIEEIVNIAAARAAREKGAHVVLNAAPARPLGAELARLVDVLVVNRVEAEMMTGRKLATRADAEAAAEALIGSYPAAVVTLGAEGLILATGDRVLVSVPARPVQSVSSHGAGDCFIGQMAAALAGGADLESACRIAAETAGRFVGGEIALNQG
jgi:ribokinase